MNISEKKREYVQTNRPKSIVEWRVKKRKDGGVLVLSSRGQCCTATSLNDFFSTAKLENVREKGGKNEPF